MKNNNLKEETVNIGDNVIVDVTELKSQIVNRNIFQIVENYKYNPKDDLNKVDVISPLGRKLLHGKVGDKGEYKVHEYNYHYEIIKILKRTNEKIEIPLSNNKVKSLKK